MILAVTTGCATNGMPMRFGRRQFHLATHKNWIEVLFITANMIQIFFGQVTATPSLHSYRGNRYEVALGGCILRGYADFPANVDNLLIRIALPVAR